MIKLYKTGDSGELIHQFRVEDNKQWRVVYSLRIDNLEVGDILDIKTAFQVTNDLVRSESDTRRYKWYKPNINVVIGLMMTQGEQDVSGYEVVEQSGENCTRVTHHCRRVASGFHEVVDPSYNYVNTTVKVGASRWEGFDHSLIYVEQDYGQLQVLHFKQGGGGGVPERVTVHGTLEIIR